MIAKILKEYEHDHTSTMALFGIVSIKLKPQTFLNHDKYNLFMGHKSWPISRNPRVGFSAVGLDRVMKFTNSVNPICG